MKYVSEENLRNWFKEMEKKYPNCPLCEQMKTVEDLMFDKFWEHVNLTFEETEEITAESLAKVCQTIDEEQTLLEQTNKVYNFLKNNKKSEFFPKEIGMLVIDSRYPTSSTKRATDSLYWLYNMGLVGYHEYEEVITIRTDYPEKVKDVKIINGVEYVGYIEKYTRDVKKIYRKWFAI